MLSQAPDNSTIAFGWDPSRQHGARISKDPALLNALTIIAHDLRGPLANLSMLIELIESHAQMRALDYVNASSRQAQDMIVALDRMLNDFLRRTRETGDPLSFRPKLVNLADVVHRAVDLNRPVAESRHMSFDCSEVEPYVISGDASLLAEAVENLIGNAVKFGNTGSTITCRVTAEGAEAVIGIEGEGEGFSEPEFRKALRPFVNLANRCNTGSASHGLGLWIVRLIAERHGGKVEVRTEQMHGGAAVTMRLPAERP